MKINHRIVSVSNKKMGEIPSFSFPPVITCANCEKCSKYCYALKMQRIRKNIGECWLKNLELWKTHPQVIECEIMKVSITHRFFRYFVAGDIVDVAFLDMMNRIARKNPHTKYLTFTKQYDMINEYYSTHRKAKNLQVILSDWGNQITENRHNFPTSNVLFAKDDTEGKMICGGECGKCLHQGIGCWQLSKGETIWFRLH